MFFLLSQGIRCFGNNGGNGEIGIKHFELISLYFIELYIEKPIRVEMCNARSQLPNIQC